MARMKKQNTSIKPKENKTKQKDPLFLKNNFTHYFFALKKSYIVQFWSLFVSIKHHNSVILFWSWFKNSLGLLVHAA